MPCIRTRQRSSCQGQVTVVWTLLLSLMFSSHCGFDSHHWSKKNNPKQKLWWKLEQGQSVTQTKQKQNQTTKRCCGAAPRLLTRAVRGKSARFIICHLFTRDPSSLDPRFERQRNKWRKFTLTWDARQQQKRQWTQFKERGGGGSDFLTDRAHLS